MERWLPVVGYEGHYEVSDLGRVRSVARVITRVMADGSVQHQRRPEKIMRQSTHGDQWYARVTLCVDYQRKTVSVHTLVLEAFVGPAPKNMECRHLDGNFLNARLENLEWGTHLENENDKDVHGTRVFGSRIGTSVLNESSIKHIRAEHARGKKQRHLASIFNVSPATINRVVHQQCWKRVA